jgi:hypothetical protein
VSQRYGLIFLTIGGDDVNFAGIVKDCLISAFVEPLKCKKLLTNAERLLSDGTIESRLKHVLSAIQERANPLATIALLGYPYLESDVHYELDKGTPAAYNVGKWLRAIEARGNAIQEQLVNELNSQDHTHGLVFVNVEKLFAGHELSAEASNPNRWFVEPLTDSTLASHETWYHPNPRGWAEEARLLLADPSIPKHVPSAAAPPVTAPPSPPPPAPPTPAHVPPTGPTLVYDGDTAANFEDGDTGFEDWRGAAGQSVELASSLPSSISSYRCVVLLLNQSFADSDADELANYLQVGGTIVAIGEHSGNPGFENADQAINEMANTLGVGLSLDDDSYDEGDTVTSNINPGRVPSSGGIEVAGVASALTL